MLFYAAAGMKCSSQHFIPHSCWEPWKIMRKITIRLQADLSMACMCKGKNSLCILEARGLIKIKAFWKQDTYILRVQSWEIMRLSQFKNLHPVHCLKPNMEAGIRTQNHMQPGGNHATHLNYQKMTMEMSGVFWPLRDTECFSFNLSSQKPYFTFQETTATMTACKQMSATSNNIWIQLPIYIKASKYNSAAEYINAIFSPPETFPVTFSLKPVKRFWIIINMLR